MVYSFTQISSYLSCPRRYRYRYLDGWKERDNRAGMLFGRAFEAAIQALFRGQDATEVLYREWAKTKLTALKYSRAERWEDLLQQGYTLLNQFAGQERIRIADPERDLQVELRRPLPGRNEFLAFVDAIGTLDGTRCVIDWKTSSARYPDEPAGLLALDPQLVCYSWITGISDVAFVVFVRKRHPEIQYLQAHVTDEQRKEFQRLVDLTVSQIENLQFPPRSGIRFPQNGCLSCPYLGLCLGNDAMADGLLKRTPGALSSGWIDELDW